MLLDFRVLGRLVFVDLLLVDLLLVDFRVLKYLSVGGLSECL